jgi:hypothetical protein
MFILSSHATAISNLSIADYDMGTTLSQGFAYGFEAFCRSFSTLTTLDIKSTIAWPLEVDALRHYSQLCIANVDLGINLSVIQVQTFQQNHPTLEEIDSATNHSHLHSTRATGTRTT